MRPAFAISRPSMRAWMLQARGRFRLAVIIPLPVPFSRRSAGPGRRLSGGKPAALIHFDAHTSYGTCRIGWAPADRHALGGLYGREAAVDAARSIQIGMRGHPSAAIHQGKVGSASEALGYKVVTVARIRGSRDRRNLGTHPITSGGLPGLCHLRSRLSRPERSAGRVQSRAGLFRLHHPRSNTFAAGP